MASGGKARIIGSGGAAPVDPYGSPEGVMTYEGIVGTGTDTIVLSTEVLPSTKGESVLLVILAAIESDGTGVPVDGFTWTVDVDNTPGGCYAGCYPGPYPIDFQESNAFLTDSPVPCGSAGYVFKDLPVGATITLTPSSGGGYSGLDGVQSVAVVFTRAKATPFSPLLGDIGWWYDNFYGARYNGKIVPYPTIDDCKGALVSLTVPWNANNYGPFSIADDIGVVLAAGKARGTMNPDSLLFYYTAYRRQFDPGTVAWDFTDIIRFTGTDSVLTTAFPPDTDFYADWSISFGFRNVFGDGSVGFDAQWGCPGEDHFGGGIILSRNVPVAAFVGTLAQGSGAGCCARGIIVGDEVRVESESQTGQQGS